MVDATAATEVTVDAFRAAFRHHPGGVAVITATGPAGPAALTATSVSSVSVEPPLLVFSVSDSASASPTIRAADSLVVHLIDRDTLHLAKLAATSGTDRFADASIWAFLPTGEPAFLHSRWIRVETVQRVCTGTATLVLARALQMNIPEEAPGSAGLAYLNRAWHELGPASVVVD